MSEVKQKNFRLPLDICAALEKDPRKEIDIAISAFRRELGVYETKIVKVAREDYEARVYELEKTLPKKTAERIALLELS